MALVPFFYNRRSLFVRKVSTLASLAGVALVVFVFSTVLMLGQGVETTLTTTGDPANVIVMRQGSQAEMQSGLSREASQILSVAPEVEADAQGALATSELVVMVVLDRRDGGGASNVAIRGITSRSLAVHHQAKVTEGRMFERGKREVVVGRKLQDRFKGTVMGESIKLGKDSWRVVGQLEAGGSGFESEIWGDGDELMPAFQRTAFSSFTARLRPGAFPAFKARLDGERRLKLDAKNEVDYYRDQSKNLAMFVRVLGVFVAVVFSMGAMIGAMITMYAQVASRRREIGTLRALGFSGGAILFGFVIESLLLSLLGGGAGTALASLMEFATFSTVNFATFSVVAFTFDLTPAIAITALVFSSFIGVAGGFAPAVRAARMKVVDAVRA